MNKTILFILLLSSVATHLKAQQEVIGNGEQWSLEVSNFRILEERKNNVVVQFDITNTGKSDIDLPYNTPLGNIEITFDDSLKKSQYAYFQHLIKEQLANEELFLPVSLVKLDFQTEILLPKNNTFKNKKKERKDIVPTILNTNISEKKDTIVNTILEKDSFQIATLKSLALSSSKNELYHRFKKDTSFYLTAEDSTSIFDKEKIVKSAHYWANFTAKDTSIFLQKIRCAGKVNLQIDSVFIKKKAKKEVILAFLITNRSAEIVDFRGKTPDIDDNISLKTYFSLLDKKTNGAIFARGMYIDKDVQKINSQLFPFQSVWLEIEIPLKLKTKFTPFVVLEINGTNTVEECSTEDNFIAIKID